MSEQTATANTRASLPGPMGWPWCADCKSWHHPENPTCIVRRTRYKWVYDTDASFEECNGEPRPLTRAEYRENYYRAKDKSGRMRRVSYARYLAYYGNPERHVYLGLIQQEQCLHCGEWKDSGSLWSIDFMDDNPEWYAITVDRWMPAAEARALPGYAGELCREGVDG